jgi:hypothetical protein
LRACDAALDWGELVFFADVFSNEELCASVGELYHGWRIDFASRSESCIHRVGPNAVYGGKRVLVGFCMIEKFSNFFSE